MAAKDAYLQQLEQANPGYVARDTGREIVLDPLSRVAETERQTYEQRMRDFVLDRAVAADA